MNNFISFLVSQSECHSYYYSSKREDIIVENSEGHHLHDFYTHSTIATSVNVKQHSDIYHSNSTRKISGCNIDKTGL